MQCFACVCAVVGFREASPVGAARRESDGRAGAGVVGAGAGGAAGALLRVLSPHALQRQGPRTYVHTYTCGNKDIPTAVYAELLKRG